MLDPSADEIRDWGNSVIEFMADYHASLRDGKVYRRMSSGEIRNRLDPVLPIKQSDFEGLLNVFRETIIPFTARTRIRACLATCNRLVPRSRRSLTCSPRL